MQIARVVGTATATVKHHSLAGAKLLVVQPLLADRVRADGDPVLAIDELGAGAGDTVLLNTDGNEVQQLLGDERTPARYSVMGIVDE